MNRKYEAMAKVIQGYRFRPASEQPESPGEYIGYSTENGICLTLFDGDNNRFFPEVDYWLPMTNEAGEDQANGL
ncbi:hypothetical protein [Sansalvadorimonas verongulae]|uniref:hypothetical protein n=1 Tax=Sansalvadorimonas verongulae TaxID=2172824 RepID=UPI0012BD3BAD|nr:hypothetical protein [Sansalvadorimonas verongulae]MTI13815.1 hypothetical protein [Sansalvadorimonas verongulae]